MTNIIQSGEFIGNMISFLGKKALIVLPSPPAKDLLPKLTTKTASSEVDKFQRKISRREAIRAGKRCTSFISIEDRNDIIKILKSLENSGLLIYGATKTVKKTTKKLDFLVLW